MASRGDPGVQFPSGHTSPCLGLTSTGEEGLGWCFFSPADHHLGWGVQTLALSATPSQMGTTDSADGLPVFHLPLPNA